MLNTLMVWFDSIHQHWKHNLIKEMTNASFFDINSASAMVLGRAWIGQLDLSCTLDYSRTAVVRLRSLALWAIIKNIYCIFKHLDCLHTSASTQQKYIYIYILVNGNTACWSCVWRGKSDTHIHHLAWSFDWAFYIKSI